MPRVTVYTKKPCSQCDMTMKLMDREGIVYEAVPLTDELMEKFRAQGVMQAPIVVIGNDGRRWSGFRPDLIKELTLKEGQA